MDDPTSETTTEEAVEATASVVHPVEEAVEATTSVVLPTEDLMKLSDLLPTASEGAATATIVEDATMISALGMLIDFKCK